MTKGFAEKCDECGKGTNSGFYANGTIYCSEPCRNKHYTETQWNKLYLHDEESYFWTEWPEDEQHHYDAEGNELVDCPYCEASGEGRYWTHDLQETVGFDCHVCEGRGKVAMGKAWADAMEACGEDYAEAYLDRHKWAEEKLKEIRGY